MAKRVSKKETAKIVGEARAMAEKLTSSDVAGESDDDCIYWPAGFARRTNPYRSGTTEYNLYGRAFVSYVQEAFQAAIRAVDVEHDSPTTAPKGWVIEGWEDAEET